tara:strand:- start:22 stop:420 length:399 start_codon:yes stop_codon:yes gene_type:complete
MYCSSCGNNLTGNENFCPSCGQKPNTGPRRPTTQNDLKTYEFKSNILLGGSILSPDRIVVTDSQVIYKKRNKYLIGTDESSIPFSRISSVEIDRKLIDSDIIIYSTGNQTIIAGDFLIGDAKKIKKIIEERI